MKKLVFLLNSCLVMAIIAQDDFGGSEISAAPDVQNAVFSDNSAADETFVVRSILDQCGFKDESPEKRAVFENGKVISFDLSNKDVAKDGIKNIPSDIGKLTSMKTFICKSNNLMMLPPEIGNCAALVKLDLSSNSLMELPLEIGRLSNLEQLDLRYNQLEALPYTIGYLKQLKVLRLWSNKLKNLDPAIANLPFLKELYLKDNRLTDLPENVTYMRLLSYIDIIGNKICNPEPKVDKWLKQHDKDYKQTQKCW
jgi:hypothetical protein